MASTDGPYANLDRPPLSAAALTRAVQGGQSRWSGVRVVDATGSTNADLVAAAVRGERDGQVLVAEEQTEGRGRLDRVWSAPPRSGLTFSMLVRPDWPITQWGWIPLAAGVALAETVRESAGLDDVTVKWPNDLLIADRKCAGILAEVALGECVIVGVGLNVTTTASELPVIAPGGIVPTSLAIAGSMSTDRAILLLTMLRNFDHLLDRDVEEIRERLLPMCSTIGTEVSVELPGGGEVTGLARDIDHDGRLVVETELGLREFAAGDVTHLRRSP